MRAEQDASSADVSRDRPVRFRASDRRWKVISVESEGKGGERDRGGRERKREREVGLWRYWGNSIGRGKICFTAHNTVLRGRKGTSD